MTTLMASLLVGVLLLAAGPWVLRVNQDRRMARPLGERRGLLEQALAAKGDEGDTLFEQALLRFGGAQEMRPSSTAARDGLIAVYRGRCEKSLSAGDIATARAMILPLRTLERRGRQAGAIGDLERRVVGTSRIRILFDPPGAFVRLSNLNSGDRPGPSRQLGPTPVAGRGIEPGNYPLTLRHADRPDVRVPLVVGRGATLSIETPLPTAEETPSGMVYVPGSPALLGDPDRGLQRAFEVAGFFIDRTEVTGAEYGRFIADTGRAICRDAPPPRICGCSSADDATASARTAASAWWATSGSGPPTACSRAARIGSSEGGPSRALSMSR